MKSTMYSMGIEALGGPERTLREVIKWKVDSTIFLENVITHTKQAANAIILEAQQKYKETQDPQVIEDATVKMLDIYRSQLSQEALLK